jgi:peptidyl-prolyl cis-trans isomerase
MENKILATIGDVNITEKDLDYMKKNMDKRVLSQFSGERGEYYLLQELINQKLMAIDAKDSDLLDNEEFKYEFESMKDNFISQYVIKTVLNSVTVSEEEVREFFETNKNAFGENESVSASHILVGDLSKAENLYEKIQNGEDFATLAKENSTCPSSANGGDLGYFGRGQMVKEFEDMAFSLEVGAVSKPVKTQFGYHLILLNDKKSDKAKSFEDIKDELKESLFAKKQQDAYVEKINSLRDKYGVK